MPTITSRAQPASTPEGVDEPVSTLKPEPGANSTEIPSDSAWESELTVVVASVPEDIPAYDRDEWRHWVDEDGDCQDTRHEVLAEESQIPVTFGDDGQCEVEFGRWLGPFTATLVTDAGELDIDHLVPLANAHESGAWAWAQERKKQFANSLEYHGHLVAVTASANRSKGSKGPDKWRPPNESYWCEYAVSWILIKETWDLTLTRAEAGALEEMLGTCSTEAGLTMTTRDGVPATVAPMPAEDSYYNSCEEATEAGETRVKGNKGQGMGFPKRKVPSARDGDGDGVVCER